MYLPHGADIIADRFLVLIMSLLLAQVLQYTSACARVSSTYDVLGLFIIVLDGLGLIAMYTYSTKI